MKQTFKKFGTVSAVVSAFVLLLSAVTWITSDVQSADVRGGFTGTPAVRLFPYVPVGGTNSWGPPTAAPVGTNWGTTNIVPVDGNLGVQIGVTVASTNAGNGNMDCAVAFSSDAIAWQAPVIFTFTSTNSLTNSDYMAYQYVTNIPATITFGARFAWLRAVTNLNTNKVGTMFVSNAWAASRQ
jgi:hypothetical protein